ncbi:AI-2E family transporter [Enterovirga rhinocerotis]|uniref:Putative PurR-regulated permease PerM n=1 Tax=Enterovirga rhinocerotis TaxID=1339210 RepID=A0A4R7CCQ4_9HYPH|nr:AI-2E family transporter [Enterovirga rhinocerotis]TDR94956.1 putative PurR-regulated permease PerM [Enterovirga rhinocerotis]
MAGAFSSSRRGEVEGKGPRFNASALVAAGIVVAGLYLAREVLVPFVIAVLLSFVLAIPVRLLQGFGLGRAFPVALVVLLAFLALFGIATVVASQATDLAGELPRYQSTIREKIGAMKSAASGSGPLERFADMLQNLSEEFGRKPAATDNPTAPPIQKPIPVEITTQSSPITTLLNVISPVLHPLAMTGLVIVFTVFMLLQRGDLRNRAIRLAGSRDLQRTTAAMNDAATRLSRFFLVQVLLNGSFGIVVGIGLWLIGVPSPILWGILAAISRFIPYVGVVIATLGPLVLAAAVDPNWTMLVITAIFFGVSEFLLGQVIEPLVYGHSTGLSPIAVIASVTFWTWLWGPIGLLLATPLTVCLVVLGRHVERLAFLDVMLGDRPPLTVTESFYQRVLAGDSGEAIEQAEDFLKEHRLSTFYDEVATKSLGLAQADLSRRALDDDHLTRIGDTMALLIEDLEEHEDPPGDPEDRRPETRREVKRAAGDEGLDVSLEEADLSAARLPVIDRAALPAGWRGAAAVVCIAGRNELDRIGALMLAQILEKHGLGTRVEAAESLMPGASIVQMPEHDTRIVVLSYLDTGSPVHIRYAVRRLRRRFPDARIVVGSWGTAQDQSKTVCETARSDACVSRLVDAAALCLDAALNPTDGTQEAALADEGEAPPLAAGRA